MKFKDMTNEELCVLYQNTKCETAFEVLYKRNYKLITSITNKFTSSDSIIKHSDDYISEANIAFYNACISYSVNSNIKFSTFAHKSILNACRQVVRKNNMAKRKCMYSVIPLDSLLNVKGSNLLVNEIITYDETVFEEPNFNEDISNDYSDMYTKIYNRLKKNEIKGIDTQVKILELFNQGYNQKQIADKLGKTHQSISATVKRMRLEVLKLGYKL